MGHEQQHIHKRGYIHTFRRWGRLRWYRILLLICLISMR